ncbi:MAG: hypothetical protein WC580_02860 [Agrococcus sp.]
MTGVLGTGLLLAVFVDGWAHFNRPGMESFFTPWHAALYAGLGLTGTWIALLVWRRRHDRTLWQAIPPGYGLAVVGIAVFAAGGVLDMLWHEVLGIEVAVDALVSPTHLLLGAGGLLILGTGVRSRPAGSASAPWRAPAVLSLVLMTALVAFFQLYTSAFAATTPTMGFTPIPEGAPGHEEAQLPVVAGLAGYLVTTAVLMLPLVYALATSARAPRGIVAAVVAPVAWLSVGVVGFPAVAVGGAVGATVAAVGADLALARVTEGALRRRLPWVAAAVTAALWAGQLTGMAVVDALRWPVSLWLGAVVLSAGMASALALLARGPRALAGPVEAA